MDPRHIVFLLLINLIWGATPIVLKLAYSGMPPFLLTMIRFLLISLVLLPVTRIRPGQIGRILLVALLAGPVQFGLYVRALAIADDVAPLAIAGQLGVPFATLLSVLFLNERVRWRRWLGMGLAFLGTVLIAFEPDMRADLDALILVTASALLGSVSFVLVKRIDNLAVFELQAWIAHLSWPLLGLVSWAAESGHVEAVLSGHAMAWLGIIYTAFGASLIAHAGFYALVQRYDVSHLAPFLLLGPVFTVILSALIFDESLTWTMMIGSVFTLTGVGIVTLREGRVTSLGPTQ